MDTTTPQSTSSATYRLVNIESGYADVAQRLRSGREVVIGCVRQEKSGSTRTGTIWNAYRGAKLVGWAHTRAAAVETVTHR